MQYKDYYTVMGIKRDATSDEIKRAYRKLARKYHPDVSKEPDAEIRFKELGEAYEVLKDPQKRAHYDQLGSEWQANQSFNPPPDSNNQSNYYSNGFNTANPKEFSEFFESLFGKQSFKQNKSSHDTFNIRGEDLQSKISISLEEAYHGTTRTLQIPITKVNNKGQTHTQTRTLNIKIPAGVTQGQQIRLTGQGNPGIGSGPNGDLFLTIELQKHTLFSIEGKDVYLTAPLTPWEAALGTTITVPTLGGNVELKIPSNSQVGQKLRLRRRGLPGKIHGDQYVILQITLPKADTTIAKELYQQMAEKLPFNPRAHWSI